MNEPRTYRHPSVQYIFILLALLLLGGGLVLMISLGGDPWEAILPGIMFLFILGYAVFTLSSTVTLSDTEITARNLLGEKSLTWGEIQQAGGGSGLKLKNIDGNVTVSIPSELPGFEEIVETVGAKCPALFAAQEFAEIDSGLRFFLPFGLLAVLAGSALAFLAYTFRGFTALPAATLIPMIILAVLFLFILGTALSTPRAIIQDGNILRIKYLGREKSLSAGEIEAVELKYQNTRSGRVYHPSLRLNNGKSMRVSGLRLGAAVMYLVLKEWHKRQTGGNFFV